MTDETTHLRALLAEQTARAERAEAERAYAYRCNEAMREPMQMLRAAVGMPAEGEGAVVAKVLSERAAALAACAEMRAALESIRYDVTENVVIPGAHKALLAGVDEKCRALLARPDLGRGWASPEDTAQMVGALQMVESDGEFDSLHEVTRKFVVDVLALLKRGGG